MANIKQAIKRVKITNKQTIENKAKRSALKTKLKAGRLAIENDDPNASQSFNEALKALDKAVGKKVLHKNNAARHKSRLTKAYNASKAK